LAEGEIVAFIDDDATADVDWLKNLVRNYDGDVVGVTGFAKPIWEDGRPRWFPEELDWIVGCSHKGLPLGKSSVRNPIGCNMSFKREIFGRVGYFESRFGAQPERLLMRSEEAELSSRILEVYQGSKIIFDPSAIVYHKVPVSRESISYVVRRAFYEGLSKRILERSAQHVALSTERDYLNYVLKLGLFSRLKNKPRPESLAQNVVLLLAISLVGIGYVLGNVEQVS
jgi:GT2 family glycosyltransferase